MTANHSSQSTQRDGNRHPHLRNTVHAWLWVANNTDWIHILNTCFLIYLSCQTFRLSRHTGNCLKKRETGLIWNWIAVAHFNICWCIRMQMRYHFAILVLLLSRKRTSISTCLDLLWQMQFKKNKSSHRLELSKTPVRKIHFYHKQGGESRWCTFWW